MNSIKDSTILNKLKHEEVIQQLPLIIYLIILFISGTAGNSLVCYIFAKKYRLCTYNTFVTVLSVVDLVTCCLSLPLQLMVQLYPYTFDVDWLCKLTLFLNTWTSITSAILLLCIAFDRYRKVCTPFSWQVSLRAAKRLCIVSPAVGITASWISPIIYGIQERGHGVYNVTISECVETENMKETLFPLINNIVFAMLFLGALISMICFYCRIAVRVKQQTKMRYRTKGGIEIRGKEIEMTSVSKDTIEERIGENQGLKNSEAEGNDAPEPVLSNKDKDVKIETLEIEKDTSHDKSNLNSSRSSIYRTTLIMFVVSLAFIVSYVPLISLLMIRSVSKTFVASLNDSGRSVYKFFLKSYLLNSAINPVIYGMLDPRFRKACKLLCSCKDKKHRAGLQISKNSHTQNSIKLSF